MKIVYPDRIWITKMALDTPFEEILRLRNKDKKLVAEIDIFLSVRPDVIVLERIDNFVRTESKWYAALFEKDAF
jgi:hypothetical protein